MEGLTYSESMRNFIEAYGIGVRAGVLTPNVDDEIAIRKFFGLPDVNNDVRRDWTKTNGTRQPITLAQEELQKERDAAVDENKKQEGQQE